MRPDGTYWQPKLETMPRGALEALQLALLQETVARAAGSPFYRKRFGEIGLAPGDIRSLDDLAKIPFTTKDDLRDSYPDGMLAVDRSEVIRLHASSGTTGKSTVIFHNRSDIDHWANLCARCMYGAGVRVGDVFQNMMGYGLFTGGLGLHYGAEKLGCLTIPASSGNTAKQIQLIQDFAVTAIHITPSYCLHLADVLWNCEPCIDPATLTVKRAFTGAEPYSETTRQKLESIYRMDVYDSYGLSEMNGPGVAFECTQKKGLHVWEDNYILEIIDPASGEPVPDGEDGEIVFTTLRRVAMPFLRYRTRDLSRVMPGECACGRTHRRLERIKGRTDDMLIVRGANVFPSQIEEALLRVEGTAPHYLIEVDRPGAMDELTVRVEMRSQDFSDKMSQMQALRERIDREIQTVTGIRAKVELVEPQTLERFVGKARRVIDHRKDKGKL